MKIPVILLLSILTITISTAQEGVVQYEVNYSPAELKSYSGFRKRPQVDFTQSLRLIFEDDKSYCQLIAQESVQQNYMQTYLKMSGKELGNYYVDIENQERIDQLKFMGRWFVVEDEMNWKWKISGEIADIFNYQCFKATTMIDSTLVTAWFTTQIAVPFGPARYSGLPGLILRLESSDGLGFMVTDVDLRKLNQEELIKKPSRGRKISRERFENLKVEKFKEVKEMYRSRSKYRVN